MLKTDEKRLKTRKKPEVRREEIIETAIDLFDELGYHKASVRDITERMGLTKAAIYYHFKNKEEILFNIVDQATKELLYIFKSSISDDKEPIDNLRDLIVNQILYMKVHRKKVKILVEDKRFLSGELNALAKNKEKTIFYLFRSYVEKMQETGSLRAFDLTTATFGIFGMINWLYHWYRPNKKLSIEKLAEQIVNILFHGLLSSNNVKPKE
jgi:TetR/AcrR family transcriptional regulator, cholesterol catabolism regulator